MGKKKTKFFLLMDEHDHRIEDVFVGTAVATSTISHMRQGYTVPRCGANITIDTLKRFCQFYNVSPNEILDWESWVPKYKAPKKNKS